MICLVQILLRKHVPDHADYTASTRQHALDHTDHTDHTDQELSAVTGRSRESMIYRSDGWKIAMAFATACCPAFGRPRRPHCLLLAVSVVRRSWLQPCGHRLGVSDR